MASRQGTIIGGLKREARFKNAADFTARQADIGKLCVRELIERLVSVALGRPGGDGGQHSADTGPERFEGMAKDAAARGCAGGVRSWRRRVRLAGPGRPALINELNC